MAGIYSWICYFQAAKDALKEAEGAEDAAKEAVKAKEKEIKDLEKLSEALSDECQDLISA